MINYDDTQVMSFDVYPQERPLVVNANGGSLAINVFDGSEFVLSDTITEDSTTVLFSSGLNIQFVPSGGATYAIDKAGRAS